MSFLPKSWQAKTWRSFNQAGVPSRQPSVASTSSESSSPIISPAQLSALPPTSRPPFVLRKLPESMLSTDETVRHGADLRTFTAEINKKRIGPSQIYSLSSRQFRWPLLLPLAKEEPGPPWLKPYPASKLQERKRLVRTFVTLQFLSIHRLSETSLFYHHSDLQRDAGVARCAAVATAGVRLREQVLAVNVGAEQTSALLLDPFKPHLVAADGDGTVRVFDYSQSVLLNQFPVVAGKRTGECLLHGFFVQYF